jgi:hypothetical protein
LPFLDAPEIRVRDLIPEIFRRIKAAEDADATAPGRPV